MRVSGAILSLVLAAPAASAEPLADLVLTGLDVYTMDAARSWARAVAVRDGRIAYVGSEAGAEAWIGPATQVLRLPGRMLLPSFQDAHVHPLSAGVELGQCNLNDLATGAAILEKVRACLQEQAGRPWVVGGGWSLPAFPGGAPTKEALDALVRERPVLLYAADGHSGWVNSKALEQAGIMRATPDPKDGRIERDPRTGEATGTLREAAIDLVARLVPPTTAEERLAGLRRALSRLNSYGITAVQEANAGAGAEGGGASDTLGTYRDAERGGELTCRVVVALGTDAARGPEQVDDLIRLRAQFESERLKPRAAKIFEDGVIEARTAAMIEPYLDRPGYRGEPNFPADRLNPLVARLAEAGFSVHVHAIGDRAIRLALDAFEAAGPRRDGLRHQIAHLEVVQPEDVPRFRALGVIANFQPLWAFADDYITELTWPALGPERSRFLYPIASLARSGAVLAFGSDWSVSSPNPLEAIQVALTRQGLAEPKRPPLLPEEAIDLPVALAAYTMGSAFANGLERETGSIEVGKAADLAVLSANLFAVKAEDIAREKVLLTLLAGTVVYRAPGEAGIAQGGRP